MRNKRFTEQKLPKPLFEEVASWFPVFNQYMTNIHRQEKEKLLHILTYSLSNDEKKNTLLNEIKPLNEELKKLPLSSMIINDLNTQTDLIKFAEYWITIDTQMIQTLTQEWATLKSMNTLKNLDTSFFQTDVLTHLKEYKNEIIKKHNLENLIEKKSNLPHLSPTTDRTQNSLLTIGEAAVYLNLAKQTVYGYTSQRVIPFIKKGKKLYFEPAALDNWLLEGKKQTQAEIAASVGVKQKGGKK